MILVIFGLSLFFILYAFFGYLLFLRIIVYFLPTKKLNDERELPKVTLLISAYNEEDIIEKKIRNALALDYPANKIDIMVVSDASTDATDRIVAKFADQGVRLMRQPQRKGKTEALNMAVPLAKGEVVVFSDANALYNTNAIKNLVSPFAQTAIGFVTGRTKYVSHDGDKDTESTSLYNRLEILTKKYESKIGSCVGADGAIFAIRKTLYNPLQGYDINDFVIPLNIIKQGYRGVLAENAFCLEETAKNLKGEFNRQVRITCRTIRAIINNKTLLSPFSYPFFSFALFSHKLMKLMLPFFMMAVLVANIILLQKNEIVFAALLLGQFLFYFMAFLGYLAKGPSTNPFTSLAHSFTSVSIAYLLGWIKYFNGETYMTWGSERPINVEE